MKVIIIEDEVNVREGFIKMIDAFCAGLEIIATADSVKTGVKIVDESDFDILFLDINLPDGSGFDLMHKVTNRDFYLIFVTAYDQYAVDAFKVSAIDYLLKPVSPDLLIKAIDKTREKDAELNQGTLLDNLTQNLSSPKDQSNKIVLNDHESLHLIVISNILYCQAEGSYTTFTLADGKKIVTSSNLKEYEQMLSPYEFVRSHHSYLVNMHQVLELKKNDGGYLVMSDQSQLPISTRKKSAITEEIKRIFIN